MGSHTDSAPTWQILNGDCRDVLATLPAASVHTCVTSPPYFGLRDYGHDGQIGLEPTPDEFVAALVGVFREVRRVLRDDGTVWLNLGDSYNADGRKGRAHMGEGKNNGYSAWVNKTMEGTKPKDLLGIPWLVAFALRADGWYLRSEIIWHKPNPMPESVTDRPTKSHEQVFLLSKSPRYFYDADAIRESHDSAYSASAIALAGGVGGERPSGDNFNKQNRHENAVATPSTRADRAALLNPAGRNKRTVWTVTTQPYAGAHFATFPPRLIEPCVLAGCPERCCSECGAPWERQTEREDQGYDGSRYGERAVAASGGAIAGGTAKSTLGSGNGKMTGKQRTIGFEPSCGCDAAAAPGTVLDPFAGAGTTGMVALRHGRSFVGVELNAEYMALARARIIDDCPLHNHGLEVLDEREAA